MVQIFCLSISLRVECGTQSSSDLQIKAETRPKLARENRASIARHARRDTDIGDTKIRAGEAVTAWIASANRDEAMFADPYALDLQRAPNRHITFGSGSHLCLGSNLARVMLQHSFSELRARIEAFELAGTPGHLASNEIAGVLSLPLRVKLR